MRSMKRLSEAELNRPSSFGQIELSKNYYLTRLHFAVTVLYESLQICGLLKQVDAISVIKSTGESFVLSVYNNDTQRWTPNLDYSQLNRAWDAGVAELERSGKRSPWEEREEDEIIRLYHEGKIFPVN